jgi:4-hydroxy-4-methyl-2-oxoglutarate aldolase
MEREFGRPSGKLLERLRNVSPVAATAWSGLNKLGLKSSFVMEGILPIGEGSLIVGPAITVEYRPINEIGIDVTQDEWRASAIYRACDSAQPSDVIAIGALGNPSGIIGDCITFGFKVKGAQGIVVDGGVRDSPIIRRTYRFPVFARNATPTANYGVFPTRVNVPIRCGGVLVKPGDVIVGDDDGVVVLPGHLLKKVVEYAEKEAKMEEIAKERMIQELPKGTRLGQLYPPKEESAKE